METPEDFIAPAAEPAATAAAPPDERARIRVAYRAYLLRHNAPPASVYQLTEELGMPEAAFYAHYASFEAIDRDLFRVFIEDARRQAEATPEYAAYGAREKLLTFYFTLLENLRHERSYVVLRARLTPFMARPTPVWLQDARRAFEAYTEDLLVEARMQNEVAPRPLVAGQYAAGFWYQLVFLLDFWLKDNSPNFERTDEAVERAVELSFDLLGRNALDSAVEFARFLFRRS